MIKKEIRKGKTDVYELTYREEWKEVERDSELEAEREKVKASLSKLEERMLNFRKFKNILFYIKRLQLSRRSKINEYKALSSLLRGER